MPVLSIWSRISRVASCQEDSSGTSKGVQADELDFMLELRVDPFTLSRFPLLGCPAQRCP
jgi:hypothetical protein